jgi:cellulose synthase operon protein C
MSNTLSQVFRGTLAAAALVIGAASAPLSPASAQVIVRSDGSGDATAALRLGRYDEAIRALQSVPRTDDQWTQVQRMLARALATVGRYDDAERTARAATSAPMGRELWVPLGDILMARGKRAEAESAYVQAVRTGASDTLTARVELAALKYDRGERQEAFREFDTFIDIYNQYQSSLSADDLVAVGRAVWYLGARDPQLFKDALRAFDRAVLLDRFSQDTRVLLGELFLQKYNRADAQASFQQVLWENPSHPRALVGEALRRDYDGQPGADSLVRMALAVNPSFVPAILFRAGKAIDIEDWPSAQRELDRALAINPTDREALAMNAGVAFMQGDTRAYEERRQRVLAAYPGDSRFFVTMAELASRVRQYGQAADLARQGTQADSLGWDAWAHLGNNLLRLGDIADGRSALERAFAGDPYSIWVKNTLDLLDTFENYETIRTPRFELMIEKSEAPIMGVYLGDLAERAYETFSKKYGYEPPRRIRMEVYRSHADFSVRTVGLAGLGALGVSFGTTLAFDSPAARDAGPFNWGSTVWHELAHTFTLGVTDHRIPRWLSEGISVYEEHQARTGWGFNVTAPFLVAFREGKLVPVSRMNDGFMRPAYPQQVQFSYYQAGLVVAMIARDHGEPALARMLAEYRAGRSTDEVFRRVLDTDMRAFDRKFDDYLRQRFARQVAALAPDSTQWDVMAPVPELMQRAARARGSYLAQLAAGRILVERGAIDSAIVVLERARQLFPENVQRDGPYPALISIHLERGDTARVVPLLRELVRQGDSDYEAHLALSRLLEKAGDVAGAADALDRAMYINPFSIAEHQRLAELWGKAGDKAGVIRERRAVVALSPVDKAEALYRLALAYDDAGDAANARRTVVRSLEEAPNFQGAQELLLRLHDRRGGGN